MPYWLWLCRGGISSVQEATVRREPGSHRENDPFWQRASEHERTPPSRVWQELSQQEDAQGEKSLSLLDPCCANLLLNCTVFFVGKPSVLLLDLGQHSYN